MSRVAGPAAGGGSDKFGPRNGRFDVGEPPGLSDIPYRVFEQTSDHAGRRDEHPLLPKVLLHVGRLHHGQSRHGEGRLNPGR